MLDRFGKDLPSRALAAALVLYVGVLPIPGTTALRSLAFAMLVGITAWQAIRGQRQLDFPLLLPWASYAAVALASIAYALDRSYSLGEIKVEIVYCFVVFVVAASWMRRADQLDWLAWIVAAGNLLFVADSPWAGVEAGKELFGPWKAGVGSTATIVATVLPWITLLAFRAAQKERRLMVVLLVGLILGNLGALFLTLNRQGWLALAASFAVAALLAGRVFWTRRRLLVAMAASFLLFGLAAYQFYSRALPTAGSSNTYQESSAQAMDQDRRWHLWRFSLERIAERPLSGGGFGREAFKMLFPDYYRDHLQLWHAHNMVINKGIQMGIPGMAAFLALWIALAAACARGLRVPSLRPWAIATLAMIAGVFVRNMADDFFIRDHALLFWLLCGAYLGVLRQATQAEGKAG
jgi:O-antigen ligase